jgi:hypothetical protein
MAQQHNDGGDTMGIEMAQTAAQTQASGVAAEIRRLGEEAFRLGEKIRKEAEAFALEEIKAVSSMEDYVRKELARLRHIENTMRMMRVPGEAPAIEVSRAEEPEAEYGQDQSYQNITQSQEEGH